jgi:aspartyl-tRNA synthetase
MAKRQDDIVLITEVELELKSVLVLNEFPRDVMLEPETVYAPEQRHLQLRSSYALRHALALRSKVGHHLRNHLISYGFTEVETPILFKSTPEGAREFLVPTRRKAMAYALVQSPQQYKQTLMASGVHRYFQFAKCFRDEDLRADRQPEFTQVCASSRFERILTVVQLDLEMGFADEHSVMQTIESIIVSLWDTMLKTPLSAFPRLPYQESMSRYGSDKPDLRLGMEV